MCTLTYLPTLSGFLFTSNRDEIISRVPARFPHFLHQASKQLLMPLDPQGGGTWILAADNGEAACLLNGAFENHERKPPYRKSRGRVILESFQYPDINDFVSHYDFDQIEPFTLVKVTQSPSQHQIHEIRWDGQIIHHRTADPEQPQIWFSPTLYDEQMRAKRRQWFDKWLVNAPDFTMNNIRHFHLHGGEGDPTVDFRMTRSGGLQTISLTSIELDRLNASVDYLSLRTNVRERANLRLAHNL
mgnify:CR=1 FL=1